VAQKRQSDASLGLAAEKHERRQKMAEARVLRLVPKIRSMANAGQCESAFSKLIAASYDMGAAHAEAEGHGRRADLDVIGRFVDARNSYDQHCVRRR
jgi:hypothetical protein